MGGPKPAAAILGRHVRSAAQVQRLDRILDRVRSRRQPDGSFWVTLLPLPEIYRAMAARLPARLVRLHANLASRALIVWRRCSVSGQRKGSQ